MSRVEFDLHISDCIGCSVSFHELGNHDCNHAGFRYLHGSYVVVVVHRNLINHGVSTRIYTLILYISGPDEISKAIYYDSMNTNSFRGHVGNAMEIMEEKHFARM